MVRIGLLIIFIAGIFVCFKLAGKNQKPVLAYYKINSVKASHSNPNNVIADKEYYLTLQFAQDMERYNKKSPFRSKRKMTILKCRNEIKDIKIFSTEKINENHLAGDNLADIFNFHYIKNMETKYGTMIKEGLTIPISEFENVVDQGNDARQIKNLKLHLSQKPIMKSEHQFIVNVLFENGEMWADTTECISFEGVKSNY
jgi:hypothetical protein